MKRKCKVIMLPAKKTFAPTGDRFVMGIALYKSEHIAAYPLGELSYGRYANGMEIVGQQHLYLLSKDKIKEGDWFYYPEGREVLLFKGDGRNPSTHCKKVIASTDPELELPIPESIEEYPYSYTPKKLPTFTEVFIRAYVKANGEINEVMVAYYIHHLEDGNDTEARPTLRSNNTVLISEVEVLSTEEEMYWDMEHYMEYCKLNGHVTPQDWMKNHKSH